MQILLGIAVVLVGYLVGSIPFGLIIVKLGTGKDLRRVESGRTGGTNAMRAAGIWAGVGTAVLDFLKGAGAVWLANALVPDLIWIKILAPVAAVFGHNYSIFLAEKNEKGYLRLRGGAGGAPTVGGSLGLWAPSVLIILPTGVVLLFLLGYASVTTMSVALLSSIIFAIRAIVLGKPWEYIFYGLIAEVIVMWSLRPNIKRLIQGNERLVGLRAWLNKKSSAKKTTYTSVSSPHP